MEATFHDRDTARHDSCFEAESKYRDLQVASMDDAAVFGKVLYQLKFSQAIERELLCDYQVVVVGVDDPSVQAEIERRSVVASLGGATLDSQTLAHHIALSKAVKDYNLKKLITFHSSVRGARDFCDDHKKILESFPKKQIPYKSVLFTEKCRQQSGPRRSIV